MGVCREAGTEEIEIVKEMAESLGSTGLRLDEAIEKIGVLAAELDEMRKGPDPDRRRAESIEGIILEHNRLVDEARHHLHWLLIQREACGFRKHRDVDRFYPIPPKIRSGL
ncbi:MAG: hypothetical protein V2B18_18775 [Pseudomonadota bacterium]